MDIVRKVDPIGIIIKTSIEFYLGQDDPKKRVSNLV
jgi:hypothetical protein